MKLYNYMKKWNPRTTLKHLTQTGIVESNRQTDKHIQLYEKVKPYTLRNKSPLNRVYQKSNGCIAYSRETGPVVTSQLMYN